jgi:hypothetical protein
MTPPRIDAFRFGQITIDGHVYTQDVIILPDRVLPNWWRESGHALAYEDLQQVLSKPPEVLLVGLGVFGRMKVPEEVRRRIEQDGTSVVALPTGEACEAYNQRCGDEKVVAALHLSC